MKRERCYVVMDGTHLLRTYYHQAEAKGAVDPDDVTERFLTRLERLKERLSRTYQVRCIVAFDYDGAAVFRRWLLPEYKSSREHNPGFTISHDSAIRAIENGDEWVGMLAPSGYEADDVVASVAYQADEKVVIHGADKDLRQCLQEKRVIICKSSRVNQETRQLDLDWLTWESFVKEYGFEPTRWVEYQCLVGDSSDDVVGAVGFGDVYARRIMEEQDGPDGFMRSREWFNKTQREGWRDFQRRLPTLQRVLTLETQIKMPDELWEWSDIEQQEQGAPY